MQSVEITKGTLGAAQHYSPRLTGKLAKPAVVHDLSATDEAFLSHVSINGRRLSRGFLRLIHRPVTRAIGGFRGMARAGIVVVTGSIHILAFGFDSSLVVAFVCH
jgi:hypothetical protein